MKGHCQVVEDDIEALQDRLSRAVAAKELLEAQLLEPPAPSSSTEVVEADGILAPQNALQKAGQRDEHVILDQHITGFL